MHRVLFALAQVLLACTDHGDTAPPAEPSTAPPRAAASARPMPPGAPVTLNLPTNDPLVAPTYKPGEPTPPTSHRLPDGREFIHDSHRDRISVRDPATRSDTDLGEVVLVAVPGLGALIVPKNSDGAYRYHDVDPSAPRLRHLWDPPADAQATLAGLDRGAPLFFVHRDGATTVDLVRVPAPGIAETHTVTLTGLIPASSDAVRDHRLLLVGATPRPRTAVDWSGPGFKEPVVLLDLATDERRRLGDAQGDWSMNTAVPHPYVAVQWTDHDRHGRGSWFSEACVNRVDPASERLTACTPAKP